MGRSKAQDRKLRIYAFDPGVGKQLRFSRINEITISIPHEMEGPKDIAGPHRTLEKGPVGEYVEVVDFDPPSGLLYSPIDLNDHMATHGVPPSEANPQFHQQMVYAVAMTTIASFEDALGRVALWSSRQRREANGTFIDEEYVRRLRIYPHALREANAYYSPSKKALLFGYFIASAESPTIAPGTIVFTCLSHDIIAHETTHALLDGMHSRFAEATNSDVLALHEAFADIVALFQHFSHSEVLYDQIAKSRGDLESENLLGQLAQEFGKALGRGAALRDALGTVGDDGVWRRNTPNRRALAELDRPHQRGAVLVAAIFDAFIAMYRVRTDDLFRIASNGTGLLPPGALHPDLVSRLAGEAAKSAKHILRMCIRALDYCPPVDIRFGDYLRAIITADFDLFPDDDLGYRTAIVEAFVAWGIVPSGLRTISTETLLWPSLDDLVEDSNTGGDGGVEIEEGIGRLIENPAAILQWIERNSKIPVQVNQNLNSLASRIGILLGANEDRRLNVTTTESTLPVREQKFGADQLLRQNLLNLGLDADREVEWLAQQFYAQIFWAFLTSVENRTLLSTLGLTMDREVAKTVTRSRALGIELPALSVQAVRMATRKGSRDQLEREYVVEVVQKRHGFFDESLQQHADVNGLAKKQVGDFSLRRGCTLLIDARTFKIRRVIRTNGSVADDDQLSKLRKYLEGQRASQGNALFGNRTTHAMDSSDFAHLHRSAERPL